MNSKRYIPDDQLIINGDGSIFHLHIKPSQLEDNIILVGDPSRVEMISSLLDSVYHRGSNREFCFVTGEYRSKRITIISTGIGSDNIDIVLNEIDAVANISFDSRMVNSNLHKLNIVRLGTCGIVDPSINEGDIVITKKAIGIDSLLNFYSDQSLLLDYNLANDFAAKMEWSDSLSSPYGVDCSDELHNKFSDLGVSGITVTAPGFYAPQGRELRLPTRINNFVERLSDYRYDGLIIKNLEMEAAPMMAMSKLLGHDAITLCVGIAGRKKGKVSLSYHDAMKNLALNVLDRI